MNNLAPLQEPTTASIKFDDLVDFFYARKPRWCNWSVADFETWVARALNDNLCFWHLEAGVEPFKLIGFAVFGRWKRKGVAVEIQMAAGNLDYGKYVLRVAKEMHPKLKFITYQRKSKYIEHKASVAKLLRIL